MSSWTKELDEAALLATKNGYFHVILFYLLCGLAAIPTSFLVFSQVFTNATPEHWCAPPSALEALVSEDQLKSLIVPKNDGVYESCRIYQVDEKIMFEMLTDKNAVLQNVTEAILFARSKEPIPCPNGWRFSSEHYNRTLVTDYSLVCDADMLPQAANILFWVGSIFGNLFFGWISDRYGRRPTILIMIALEVPLAIAASFPSTYWSYIALRIAGGLFFPALYQLPFVLALELMPPGRRTYTGIVVGMLFASGMCLLALLAYALRDWFYLSLCTSLPFLLLYSYYWLIPESPRWLVSRGRIAEAEKVLRNIASKNGIELQRGFLLELHKKAKEQNMETESTRLSCINGHLTGCPELCDKEYYDTRICNMLTYKCDKTKELISDDAKEDNLERVIALEVSEIVNKKSRLKRDVELSDERKDEELENEESQLRLDSLRKSNCMDHEKLSASAFRRKSSQLVNRILNKNPEEDLENRIMDDQNSEGDCKASPLDVFRYPNIRKKFVILTFDWVALGVVYNSLSYNTPNLGVDDYLAFFIGGAVELPSYFIAWRCMDRFGRRWVLCIFMCVGGLACLCCLFVPDAWPWITVSLAMIGRLCSAASFAVFYVLIGELLPTVLRSQAMGAASFISGLGLLACPYIVRLAKYFRALPLTIMGVLSILGGITSLFLPETLNQPLPQTLGDGEMFGRDFKILSCVERQSEL